MTPKGCFDKGFVQVWNILERGVISENALSIRCYQETCTPKTSVLMTEFLLACIILGLKCRALADKPASKLHHFVLRNLAAVFDPLAVEAQLGSGDVRHVQRPFLV